MNSRLFASACLLAFSFFLDLLYPHSRISLLLFVSSSCSAWHWCSIPLDGFWKTWWWSIYFSHYRKMEAQIQVQFYPIVPVWGHGISFALISKEFGVNVKGPPKNTTATISRRQMKLYLACFVFPWTNSVKLFQRNNARGLPCKCYSQDTLAWSNF